MTATLTPARRLFDWAFRSREDGRVVIAQWPNAPILVWGALTAARLLARPEGGLGVALEVAATAALLVWAVLELLSGVNPFRRALGGVVLLWVVVSVATRLA